jgi:SPASM domain peptide maturase of grasp-with-spasm system
MKKNDQHILLFSSCALTKGYTQTLLVDFQRKTVELLPNEFYTIFTKTCREKTYAAILDEFVGEDRATAQEYFDYLLQGEYAFVCDPDELALYPEADMQWDYPAIISNALVDFKPGSPPVSQYEPFFKELSDLGCSNLQVRCYYPMPLPMLETLYQHIGKNDIYRTELLLQYDAAIPEDAYRQFLVKIPYINSLILHGYPKNIAFKCPTDQKLYGIKETLASEACCGNISVHYFNVELTHYTESLHFNTCLNRKVAVDADGNIKNCPSMKESYGKVGHTPLRPIVSKPGFQQVGHITKDQVTDCKVCEYRHICTDCRAYTSDGTLHGKPLKCTYDPYKGEWL